MYQTLDNRDIDISCLRLSLLWETVWHASNVKGSDEGYNGVGLGVRRSGGRIRQCVCVCTWPVCWETGSVYRMVLEPRGIECYEPVLVRRQDTWEIYLGW